MKIRYIAFLPLFLALAAASICRADTTYTLTATDGPDAGLNVVFDSPSGPIASGDDSFGTCKNGDSCGLYTSAWDGEPFDEWDDTNIGPSGYALFIPGAFSSPGTYFSTGQVNSLEGIKLVVSGEVAATPEPSSLMLLGTGLAGIAGVIRRRRLI